MALGQDEGIGENAGPKDGIIANGREFKQAEAGVPPCDEKVQVPTEENTAPTRPRLSSGMEQAMVENQFTIRVKGGGIKVVNIHPKWRTKSVRH